MLIQENEEIYLSSCPICDSSFNQWREKKNTDKIFKIVRCDGCNFAFINPRPTQDYLINFYTTSEDYARTKNLFTNEITTAAEVIKDEEDYPNATKDAKRIVKNIKKYTTSKSVKFLDIGSGYGFFSKEALFQKFVVTSIELNSKDRKITEDVTGLKPSSVSFENFEDQVNSYSAILMSQIFEHALDIDLWTKKAHKLLSEGGILAIALPNFNSFFRYWLQENDPYIIPPEHLNFFSPSNLSLLLEKHGFEIIKVEEVTRIDPRVIVKKLPLLRLLGRKSIVIGLTIIFKIFDFFKLGMMINIYARKIKSS